MKATIATKDNALECVNLIIVSNPLMPADSRQVYHREWTGESLLGYVSELSGNWAILSSHAGPIAQEKIGDHIPIPGEFISMTPTLAGGDSGKDILRLTALVTLAVISGGIMTGQILGGVTGATAGAMTGSSIALAIGAQVGGTLLINHLLPPSAPTQKSRESDTSYGIDGPKNTSTEGLPVPVIYGEHWVGGNIISLFVDNVGSNQQYLNMLINLGEGEIEGVTEIYINDQPLSSFKEVQTFIRKGTDNQAIIPYFDDIVAPTNRNVKVARHMTANYNDSEATRQANLQTGNAAYYTSHVTTGPANRIRLDMLFPIGLGVQHNDGDFDAGGGDVDGCNFVMGYREEGSVGAFKPFGAWDYVAANPNHVTSGEGYEIDAWYDPGTEDYSELEYVDEDAESPYLTQTGMHPKSLGIVARGNSRAPIRRSYVSGELDPSKRYEIRIYNSQDDDVETTRRHRVLYLSDVNEIRYDNIRYNFTALLGLRIKMNDQLSSIPKVLCRVKGRRVQVFDENTQAFVTQWTQNPAWHIYDAMTNTRFGAGIPPSSIKLAYFRELSTYCEDNNLQFNGVIDELSNIYDSLKSIFRVARSRLVRSGTRYQLATQKSQPSQMLFSVGNVRKGSMNINWTSKDARANEIHVSYYDLDDFSKRKTVIVQDNVARLRGDDVRKADLDMRGVVTAEQASREGAIALNMNKLTQTVTFDAPIESISITIGDVFSLQHDMPSWGFGGLTAPGSTTTVVKLDKPVQMTVGNNYEILVKHDFIVVHSGTVDSVASNTVYLVGAFDPQTLERMRRLKDTTAGIERQILEYVWSGSAWGIVLDDATGIVAGHSVQLVDTDVIESKPVVVATGEFTEVTTQSPLKAAPASYSGWAFGQLGVAVRKFSCVGISGDGSHWRTITGLEYNEAALSDTPVDVISPAATQYPIITAVDFQGWSQSAASSIGNPNQIRVEAHWSCSEDTYDKAEVYMYKSGLMYSLGTYTDRAVLFANEGDLITIAIVPVDRYGRKPDVSQVEKFTYSVSNQYVIDSPQNLTLTQEVALTTSGDYQTNVIFSFDEPNDIYHVIGYEVEYKLARRPDWTPIGFGLERVYEIQTAELGILQFRVRSVYVKDVAYSDWAVEQITVLGTNVGIAQIGIDDPINPRLYISTNSESPTARIRVQVDQPAEVGVVPDKMVIYYSADDRPNTIESDNDVGSKVYLKSVGISGEFELDVAAGSTTKEVKYADPQDIVDIDLSGLWWFSVDSPVNGKTRYFKVNGVSTSELKLAQGDELPFVPAVGDTIHVIEIEFHDSRLPEFRLAWCDDEVFRHNGIKFDEIEGKYYFDIAERGAEGTDQKDLSNKTIHYYPALGPDTIAEDLDASQFSLNDGVYSYSGSIDIQIPSQIAWASVTCCFVRRTTSDEGFANVRSNIVPLTISGEV